MASASATAPKDIPSAMKNLSISTSTLPTAVKRSAKSKGKSGKAIAESWEDDAEEDDDETPTEPSTAEGSGATSPTELSRHSTDYNPHPPPPTPASPTANFSYPELSSSSRFPSLAKTTSTSLKPPASISPNKSRTQSATGLGASTPEKRPEKTTSTASRLIAAGLGVKAPRRTEAEREYDRTTREAERKKKEEAIQDAKRKEQNAQKAKEAVWDD